MGPTDLLFHLLGFAAPAIAVAVMAALTARVFVPDRPEGLSWWLQSAISSVAGVVVLAAGLWHFGVDGKMATYSALVLVVASCQWFCSRGWRG